MYKRQEEGGSAPGLRPFRAAYGTLEVEGIPEGEPGDALDRLLEELGMYLLDTDWEGVLVLKQKEGPE